jgi:hypothetical protein
MPEVLVLAAVIAGGLLREPAPVAVASLPSL